MNILIVLAEWSFAALGVVLLAGQFVCHELGYRAGLRHAAQSEKEGEGVGVVVGGMLGLLGFVLALTLSFASTRFNETRSGTLEETNAIGTAWLRAQAVDHPRAREIATLLEHYTQVRLDFIRASIDSDEIAKINAETNALQNRMWGDVAVIVREAPNPLSVSLMTSLNDVFDMTTAERFAYEKRLPAQLFWLLLALAGLAMASLGYQLGLKNRPARGMVLLLMVMWTAVIVSILDMASARFGSIRTGTAAYEWTLQGFKGGVPIPPPPAPR